jgi:glycosyltransferase involved in cell wall biosynthesis
VTSSERSAQVSRSKKARHIERMRVIYLAPHDLLIPRVDRQCTMSFAEALGQTGVDVEVVCFDMKLEFDEPTRDQDLYDVYGVQRTFKVITLPSRARQSGDGVSRTWRAVAHSSVVLWKLLADRRTRRGNVIYLRNYLIFPLLLTARRFSATRALLLFEVHAPPERSFQRWVLRRADGIISISGVLRDRLCELPSIDHARVLTAHQGVNLKLIEKIRLDRNTARARLGISAVGKFAVYTGKVYNGYREIDLLLETARRLPEDVQLLIVGGREDHVNVLRQRARQQGLDRVRFVGFVAPTEVFLYQMAADVLLSYYPGDIELNDYRSPGKLFEYMASRTPIIAADYASLREVLGEDAAAFVARDDPESLATEIVRLLRDPIRAERLAREAWHKVQDFTWDRRAERVLDFADRLSTSSPLGKAT